MPYVISTSCSRCGGAGTYIGELPAYEMRGGGVSTSGYVECHCPEPSRRAVATLEEARGLVAAEINRVNPANLHPAVAQYDALDESGGTVGPLPDGTVIEVEFVTENDLARLVFGKAASAGSFGYVLPQMIDAYNAREV